MLKPGQPSEAQPLRKYLRQLRGVGLLQQTSIALDLGAVFPSMQNGEERFMLRSRLMPLLSKLVQATG